LAIGFYNSLHYRASRDKILSYILHTNTAEKQEAQLLQRVRATRNVT